MFIFSNKERVMQKRFCSCGASVWVRYFFANTRWFAFFYSGENGGMGMDTCPCCGSTLDIQDLR